MPNISATAYNHFRTCPRLFYWEDLLKIVRVREEGARRFGTMFHAGLEAWWKECDGGLVPWKDRDVALVRALGAIAENARHIQTDPFEVARAEAIMVAYHARYFELEFERVDGGGVEEWFRVPLKDPRGTVVDDWFVTGKRDAMMKFADEKTKVVEHKTTSSEINGASDYWARLKIDTQCSMYIDSARQLGLGDVEALYDVVRKPDIRPLLATPEDKRKMTKGKGCKYCGGRAGGKGGVAPGTGRIMIRTKVDGDGNLLPSPIDVETACNACNGTGWQPGEEPRLPLNQRAEDESPLDFKDRIADELSADPDKWFRQGTVTRSPDQLAEGRADLVATVLEIDTMTRLAHRTGNMQGAQARQCFPRNSQACTSIYGRRCDYLDVCSGADDPLTSPHYQIKTREPRPSR